MLVQLSEAGRAHLSFDAVDAKPVDGAASAERPVPGDHGAATGLTNEALFAANEPSDGPSRKREPSGVRAPCPPKLGIGSGPMYQNLAWFTRAYTYCDWNASTPRYEAPNGPKRGPCFEQKNCTSVVGWVCGTTRDSQLISASPMGDIMGWEKKSPPVWGRILWGRGVPENLQDGL